MGCRILEARTGEAILYDSVSGWALGPVFDCELDARSFLAWLHHDARSIDTHSLRNVYREWIARRRPAGVGVRSCGERDPKNRYFCTRAHAHDGDHVAHDEEDRVVWTWPATAAAPEAP